MKVAILLLAFLEAALCCQPLWSNQCQSDFDCCSTFCERPSNWRYGVCKNRNGVVASEVVGNQIGSSESTGGSSSCLPLWSNRCSANAECCTNFCEKPSSWKYGVCKNGNGRPASNPSGSSGPSRARSTERGVCSWYGSPEEGLEGKHTASGELFSASKMTAAHKTLPFGTNVRVSCNGRSVTVRVNDRGPFTAGRIIDVSAAAADVLGIRHSGLCDATVDVL